MNATDKLLEGIAKHDLKSLARTISLIENESPGYEEILTNLKVKKTAVVGITGPPGSGKSSLLNCILNSLLDHNKKIGVIAVDPSSPFNFGALLGDRIRMSSHFNNPDVYIRSLSSRGSLGGLSDKIIEVLEVMKSFNFDYIFIETVGVGQSEVEVAGIADTTIIVLVPESGDQVQAMKAGLMEVGDIFVVNKADHIDAEKFANNLQQLIDFKSKDDWVPPIIKTIATQHSGVDLLIEKVNEHLKSDPRNSRKILLLADKVFRIIQKHRMKEIDRDQIIDQLMNIENPEQFNIYNFIRKHFSKYL